MLRLAAPLAALATPALAAGEEYGFVSLRNTDFVVLLAFLLFVGVLLWFGVPRRVAAMLDARAQAVAVNAGIEVHAVRGVLDLALDPRRGVAALGVQERGRRHGDADAAADVHVAAHVQR